MNTNFLKLIFDDMIKKVKKEEYLNGYGTMSDGERREYQNRVGEWMSTGGRRLLELTERPMAKSQNIMLLSARWKEPEVTAFADGARLLSALIGVADTWLPTQLYAKSAYRAVRKMVALLGEVSGFRFQVSGGGDAIVTQQTKKAVGSLVITKEQKQRIIEKYTKKVLEKHGKTPAAKPQGTVTAGKATGTVAKQNPKLETGEAMKPETLYLKPGVPARPRHIDQYVHLLPEETQKRAARYGGLMREFDAAREKLRIVMDDAHASDHEREQWAKKVNWLDVQIGDVRRELDLEWEKVAASGRVFVDDLGIAHVVDEKLKMKDEKLATDAQGGDQELETLKPEAKAADDLRRAALLRKWLIDTRYGNKDAEKRTKYQEKWREKYREMVRIGGMEAVTEKVREAAKHYEIDIEAIDKEVKPLE